MKKKLAYAVINLFQNYQQWSETFSKHLIEYQRKHDWQTLANHMLKIANTF